MITTFKEMPVGVYEQVLAINAAQERDDLERQVATIAALSGTTDEEVLNMPLPDYKVASGELVFLTMPVPIRKDPKPAKEYRLGDLRLVPSADPMKMTAAQYIDFQTVSAQAAKEKHGNLSALLACFLIPKGCRYNEGYDIREVQAAIRDGLDVVSAIELLSSFFAASRKSMQATLTSSTLKVLTVRDKERRRTAVAVMKKALQDLESAGAGWQLSTPQARPPAVPGARFTI